MLIYLMTVGLCSILGQVVLLRELSVAFFGVELIYIVSIGIWLLCGGAGAVLGRRKKLPKEGAVGSVFLLVAVLVPAGVAFIRSLRVITEAVPGTFLPFDWQLLGVVATLLPVSLLLGLLFVWAARIFVETSGTLASAYAIESGGGLLGGMASTLLLKYGFQNWTSAILCSLAITAVVLGRSFGRRQPLRYAALPLSLVLLLLLWFSRPLDLWLSGLNHPDLVDMRDSPYSRVTIIRQSEIQLVVLENNALEFETESVLAEELVHPAFLQSPALERILLLGSAAGGELREVLKYDPAHVDVVEINPVLLELVSSHLPSDVGVALESAGVEVHLTDPRVYVKGAVERYDVILIAAGDPESGLSNRFYTREFFERCSSLLKDAGVLAFRLSASENIWTRFAAYRNGSVYRALAAVFPYVQVLPGSSNVFLASRSPLSEDPSDLGAKLIRMRIRNRLVIPPYLEYLYINDRYFEMAARFRESPVPANLDLRPVCYRYSSLIWLSMFLPSLINRDPEELWISALPGGFTGLALLLCCLLIFGLVRRRDRTRRVLLVGVAGFLGMVLETVFLLHYQVKNGVLFQNIGLLLMVFMAGLALGAWVIHTASAEWRAPGAGRHAWFERSFVLGFALLGLAYLAMSAGGLDSGLPVICALLFADGFLVSGVFALMGTAGSTSRPEWISPLYASDLVGGSLGCLLAGLLLVPFQGLDLSVVAMVLLGLAALLLT